VAATWREARPLIIAAEATFVLVFLLAVWVRSYNAAIAGQEKQMDLTFLHSLIQSPTLPAEDLWFARYGMPYYYLGYFTQAIIAKAVAADPVVAYNLAVATVLALSALGAFGLAASLTRLGGASTRWAIGLGATAAFVLTVMGNLEALFEWIAAQNLGDAGFWAAMGIKNLQPHLGGFPPTDGGWWFRAARVIPNIQPDGITEFPYFSFLLGDLHPHYMAIPLGVLIATLAAAHLCSESGVSTVESSGAEPETRNLKLEALLPTAVVLGAVIAFNTWDVPVLWGVFALTYLAGPLRAATFSGAALVERGRALGSMLILAVALYLPYFVGYVSQELKGFGPVPERTYFGSLFVLFGPLLVLPLAAGAIAVGQYRHRWLAAWPLAVAIGGGCGLVLLREPTLGFLLACLALWLPLTWVRVRSGEPGAAIVTGIITIAGLGSILVPELVFLRDSFDTRMNTVFKFYYDAWIMLALAAPLLAWELLTVVLRQPVPAQPAPSASRPETAPAWPGPAAAAAVAAAALLTLGGAIYPLAATHTKSGGFGAAPTLDGMAFLRSSRPDDAAAIDWLRRSHPGAAIVEAVGNDYTDAGRFASFAGTPNPLGWIGHELQWRGRTPELDRRQQLVRRVYSDVDPSGWRAAINQLGAEFVVVGTIEREIYGADVQTRFEGALPSVHRTGNTSIYRVPAMGDSG
jgi:YYY domain-containing protein